MSGSVVVVGAGITGLVCAHRLVTDHPGLDVTILEASDRAGGKIRTTPIAGIDVDEGADAFLARVPAAVSLCRELGLGDELVTPAERRAFVYRHGALRRFPEGLVLGVPTDLAAPGLTDLLSPAGIARAAEDLHLPREIEGAPPIGEDESVGSLVRRRVGDEIMDAIVGPLLSGVNAGDADALSLEAGAPQFAAAVRDQPSLIAGLRAQRDAALRTNPDPTAPIFYGLRGGTQTLIDALVAHLPSGSICASSPVDTIQIDGGGTLVVGGRTADAVVLAVPSHAATRLVRPVAPDLGDELGTLEWSSVALVTFAVRRDAIDHPLDGSGFLVSEGEGLLMTACSFGSTKWAHWRDSDRSGADDELVILRVSAGRSQDPRASALDDGALVAQLLDDLRTTIGLRVEPAATRVSRYADALPQYRPGHLERAARWKAMATVAHPGLFLAGASYFGLGIPACITDATDTAARVAAHLDGTAHA
jgi:oxygen-dependent protoporphyrinogen oxidase